MRPSVSRIVTSVGLLLCAMLFAQGVQAQVVINEIHYNPPGSDGTVLLEYIELHNPTGAAVNLTGWNLDFGTEPYVFDFGSSIGPGAYIVVAENIANLNAATGYTAEFTWAGVSAGLSNGGEWIRLWNGLIDTSTLIDAVQYDDDPPWPTTPDGEGPSLERINPSAASSQPTSWRASLVTNGSPGAQNSTYTNSPTVFSQSPRTRSAVETLPSVTVTFSTAVDAVVAGDLTVNGAPADTVVGSGAGPYEFSGFTAPAPGSATIAIGPGSINAGGVPFGGETWTISVGLVVVLNEFHYHPADPDDDAEFVEIYNAGTNPANMDGWTISDGLDIVFPPATTLPSGGYIVIALDSALLESVTGYAGALQWTSGRLSNGGERIALSDATGNELDVVRFRDGGEWPDAADGDGPSLELINPALPNEYGAAWAASLVTHGTPGAQNGSYDSAPPPIISNVQHDPPIPGANQPVTVTAIVFDDEAVTAVTLQHRQDQEPTLGYTATPMLDDGLNGDVAAGDSVYTVVLPDGLVEGARLDFAVQASDGVTSSVSPSGHNGVFPGAGSHPARTYLCKFSSEPLSTEFPSYHLITTQYTRNLQDARNKNEYDATFIRCPQSGVMTACEVFYNATERYRGQSSLNQDPPSFRIDLPSNQPMESEMGFELRSINLLGQQPARQPIGYGTFAAAGLIAPRHQHVRFNTNPLSDLVGSIPDGHQNIIYNNVERIDEEFLASQNGDVLPARFPDRCSISLILCDNDADCPVDETCEATDSGNLYRGRNDADLRWEGTNPDTYRTNSNDRNGYQKITNDGEDDWTDLITLCDALTCSTSDTGTLCDEDTYDGWFQENLETYADVEQWARWFAVHAVLDNTEGGIYRDAGDDYFLYFWPAPTYDHATMLPWDMDAIIPNFHETIWRAGINNPNWAVRRVLRNNAYAGHFVGAVCEYMDTFFNQTTLDGWLDDIPDAAFDEYEWQVPQGNGSRNRDGMKAWFGAQITAINNEIVRQTTLQGVPASPYTDPNPLIALSGDLNQCGAREVRVNGIPANYTIANPGGVGASWTFDFTLTPGLNNIVVQTVDHDGVVIDFASDSVIYTPPGSGGEPDSVKVTMPTRMVNSKTLTLRADILDAIGQIHWQTWTDVGIVSARRVSDQTPVATSVTVFETRNAGTGAGGPGPDEIRFYNGVGSVSITLDDPASVVGEDLEIMVDVLGLTGSSVVTVLDENDAGLFTNVSGALSGAVTWGPSDGVIHVTGNVTVASGSTLTIEPGTLIMIDAGPANNGTTIILNGGSDIQANGTEAEPIMLFPTAGAAALVLPQTQDNNHDAWRGINHLGTGSSTYTHVFFVGAGNGPTGGHPRASVLRTENTHTVVMDDCVVADVAGKALFILGDNNVTVRRNSWSRIGYGGEFLGGGHTLLIEDSWFTRIGYGPESVNLDGDIFHLDNASSSQTIRRSVLADCGDDMMDHSSANPVVEDTLIWDADDKCVSLSGGGSVTFNNVLVFGMPLGVNGAGGILTHVTINVGSTPMGAPISVDNSIIWPQGMNTGACNGNINYTLAGTTGHLGCGTGNLSTNPLFQDPGNYDYSLQAGSPAANAGPTGGRIGWLGFPNGTVCVTDGDCDDGNACTNDSCDAGACVATPIAGCTPCVGDGDCDDADPCTVDTCNAGICAHAPGNDGASCNDGQNCTIDDLCAAGTCVGDESCPLGQACDEFGECAALPTTLIFRDDGAYTGTQDTFVREAAPTTVYGAATEWEWDGQDPNPSRNFGLIRFDDITGPEPGRIPPGSTVLSATLTLTVFDPSANAAGTVHEALILDWTEATTHWDNLGPTPGPSAGEDYDASSVGDAPVANGTFNLDVTASVQNWVDTQAGNFGWVFVPAAGSTDGVQVRSAEYGVVLERPSLSVEFQLAGCDDNGDCDDGNACTDDICNAGICEHPYNTAPCDDGNACTTDDVCSAGTCGGAAIDCTDGDPCTDDICNAGICEHPYNTAPCDDGNACTTGDVCSVGACAGGEIDCSDGDPCTDDICNAGICEHPYNTAPCDDGNACTTGDVCSVGACAGGEIDCSDGDPCTDDICNAGICEHPYNTAPCDDGNACTTGDVCSVGACAGGEIDCSDGDPCTDDICNAGICEHPYNTAPCDDGNACTTGDVCSVGACAGGEIDCSDGDPCTDDICNAGICEHPYNTAPCDDGNACTTDDVCTAGSCAGVLVDCSFLNDACVMGVCNVGTGQCETQPANEGVGCDDGMDCTVGDACSGGVCAGTVECPPGQLCDGNGQCAFPTVYTFQEDGAYTGTQDTVIREGVPDENNGALDNWDWDTDQGSTGGQNVGLIRFESITGSGMGQIPAGARVASATLTLVVYDESSAPPAGIHTVLVDWDESTATWNNFGGEAGMQPDEVGPFVADAPVATGTFDVDVTSAVQAWVDDPAGNFGLILMPNSTNGAHVRSSEYANVAERPKLTVVLSTCILGENCDDGNSCTDDICNAGICQHSSNTAPCDDGNACTTDDACLAGACGGNAVDCDDGNICTADSCSAADGCQYANNSAPCDDDNACTVGDTCGGGSCQPGTTPLDCDDGNICTADSCNTADGCQYANNSAPCDDDNACTVGDTCGGGSCQPGTTPLDCDDGNICTADSCNAADGCQYANNSAPCDDDNACTVGDTCGGGSCQPGTTPLDCDDGNICTADSCNTADGCQYANNSAPCDDDNACTVGDTCGGGSCQPGTTPLDCDDEIICTADTCDPVSGCANMPLPDQDIDGLCDIADNCPTVSNPIQENNDTDPLGDACDNCPLDDNLGQEDQDNDLIGDVCDCNPEDPTNPVPPEVGNTLMVDRLGTEAIITWSDEGIPGPFYTYRGFCQPGNSFEYNQDCLEGPIAGTSGTDTAVPIANRVFYYLAARGNACGISDVHRDSNDTPVPDGASCLVGPVDSDGDTVPDYIDNCPGDSNPLQEDLDADGYGDACDNCVNEHNPAQANLDGDLPGNACDPDLDGDGILEDGDGIPPAGNNPCTGGQTLNCDDNCPFVYNPEQADGDADGVGDACG